MVTDPDTERAHWAMMNGRPCGCPTCSALRKARYLAGVVRFVPPPPPAAP